MVTEKSVTEKLKKCLDPELQLDVITLGLIYKITINNNDVSILMTLTTPMCPYGPALIEDIKNKVSSIKGVTEVKVDITFDPLWQPSEELRSMLGV